MMRIIFLFMLLCAIPSAHGRYGGSFHYKSKKGNSKKSKGKKSAGEKGIQSPTYPVNAPALAPSIGVTPSIVATARPTFPTNFNDYYVRRPTLSPAIQSYLDHAQNPKPTFSPAIQALLSKNDLPRPNPQEPIVQTWAPNSPAPLPAFSIQSPSERPITASLIEPITEQPVTFAPVPITEQPVSLAPMAPITQQSVTWAPAAPITEQPATWTPAAPITEQPATWTPAAPITKQPFTWTPVVTDHPVTLAPVHPFTEQPVSFAPIAGQPVTLPPVELPRTPSRAEQDDRRTQIPTTSPSSSPSRMPVLLDYFNPAVATPISPAPSQSRLPSSNPTDLSTTSPSPVALSPVTASPADSNPPTTSVPVSLEKTIFRREFETSTFSIEITGYFDLMVVQGILFEVIEGQMRPYLVESIGAVLEDFELSMTFKEIAPWVRVQPAVVTSEIMANLMLANADKNMVNAFTDGQLTSLVKAFFMDGAAYEMLTKLGNSGIEVKSLLVLVPAETSSPSKVEEKGHAGLIAGMLSGGFVCALLAATVVANRKKHFGVQEEMALDHANLDESKIFLFGKNPSKIGDFDNSSFTPSLPPLPHDMYVDHDYLLDAPEADISVGNKDSVAFKMVDGPDLVASTTNWADSHSIGDSTVYTRTQEEDAPRPEYGTNQRTGKRWRPWINGKYDPKGGNIEGAFPRVVAPEVINNIDQTT